MGSYNLGWKADDSAVNPVPMHSPHFLREWRHRSSEHNRLPDRVHPASFPRERTCLLLRHVRSYYLRHHSILGEETGQEGFDSSKQTKTSQKQWVPEISYKVFTFSVASNVTGRQPANRHLLLPPFSCDKCKTSLRNYFRCFNRSFRRVVQHWRQTADQWSEKCAPIIF